MYNGAATLSWAPNSEPDLAGYKVYAGPAPRDVALYTQSATTTGLTHTFGGFAHDTHWFFAVTAIDLTGNESTFSAEVHKHMIVSVLTVVRTVT